MISPEQVFFISLWESPLLFLTDTGSTGAVLIIAGGLKAVVTRSALEIRSSSLLQPDLTETNRQNRVRFRTSQSSRYPATVTTLSNEEPIHRGVIVVTRPFLAVFSQKNQKNSIHG
jgi:uncharacterized membrane protein